MADVYKLRRIRDRWEAACPYAFVGVVLSVIMGPTTGLWVFLGALAFFALANIGFFYFDWRVQKARLSTDDAKGEG